MGICSGATCACIYMYRFNADERRFFIFYIRVQHTPTITHRRCRNICLHTTALGTAPLTVFVYVICKTNLKNYIQMKNCVYKVFCFFFLFFLFLQKLVCDADIHILHFQLSLRAVEHHMHI